MKIVAVRLECTEVASGRADFCGLGSCQSAGDPPAKPHAISVCSPTSGECISSGILTRVEDVECPGSDVRADVLT